MTRFVLLLIVLTAIAGCAPGVRASSKVDRATACGHILDNSAAVVRAVTADKTNATKVSQDFKNFAGQIRSDVSTLSASDLVHRAGDNLATDYDSAAARISALGYSPKTVGSSLPRDGAKLLADCK